MEEAQGYQVKKWLRVASASLAGVAVFSCRPSPANLLLIPLLISVWWLWRHGELGNHSKARMLLPPLVAFAGASLVSAFFSLNPVVSLDKLTRVPVFLLVPAAAALVDPKWWRRIVVGLAVVTTILAVWGIVEFMQGANTLEERIHGPFSHYMRFAGWMLLAVLILAAEAVLGARRALWYVLPPALLGTVALFLSFTRNAWVGLAVGLLVLAAVWRRLLLIAYPALALLLWLAFPRPILDRAISVFDLRQHANYDRLCMVISGVEMVRDHPWTGVGLDQVQELYPLYRVDDAPRWRVPHLHNNVLQIAAERGLPALGAYLWLIAAFATVTWRAVGRATGDRRAGIGACLVAILGITAAGMFEYNFWAVEIQYLSLILLGVGVGWAEEAAA